MDLKKMRKMGWSMKKSMKKKKIRDLVLEGDINTSAKHASKSSYRKITIQNY